MDNVPFSNQTALIRVDNDVSGAKHVDCIMN